MGFVKQLEPNEFDHWLRRAFREVPSADEKLYIKIWQRIERHIRTLDRSGSDWPGSINPTAVDIGTSMSP